MTSNNECNLVQENIAWGKNLSNIEQNHILNCPKCSAIAVAFEDIDSALKESQVEIPEGFADRVMAKVMKEEAQSSFNENVKDFFMMLFNNQILRWGIGGTSFLIAFSAH